MNRNLWKLSCLLLVAICGQMPQIPGATPDSQPRQQPNRQDLAGIAFVGGHVLTHEKDPYPGSYHWRDGYVYPRGATYNAWERTTSAPRPGRNLFSLIPATTTGKLTQLTFLSNGEVYDPEPSYDGKKILFSMRKDGEDWFHLFEIGINGQNLTQLTDGPFNDVSGTYLPDGRIVFCSDRTGVLDEYHEERSEFLFRMNSDGSGIEQLTFNPGIYFEPTILQNGLILCSYWDAFHISVPPFLKHETYLITLRPDGTEERPFFGVGEYRFLNRTRHSAIGLTKPTELPDGKILLQSEMGPSICDVDAGTHFQSGLTPVFPATASVQTGGTTHASHVSPTGTRTTPFALPDGTFLMAATLPGSRDLGLYRADPSSRRMQPIFDRPNLSEWDPIPVNSVREKPVSLPDYQSPKGEKFATFVVAAARDTDTSDRRSLNERARFIRVLQSEYTTVTTSSHTSLETRILGTVPIQPDGSVAFEAPADTPLFIETLDARGNRLVLQAGHMSARAGEIKSCFGCHATEGIVSDNSPLQALNHSLVRITREASDLSYRRNDPQEYRRQASITEGPKYRLLLDQEIPELVRQGLEGLSYLPDEVTSPDRKKFVAFLKHSNTEVRRQAALSLAVTGTIEEISALVESLQDEDHVVRHYCAMALEAVTGENVDLFISEESPHERWNAWLNRLAGSKGLLSHWTQISGKWTDDFSRDAWMDAVSRTRWLSNPELIAVANRERGRWKESIRSLLSQEPPATSVVKASGMLRDEQAVGKISTWLIRGMRVQQKEQEPDTDPNLALEVRGTKLAQAAAEALGRIGTHEAVQQLLNALAGSVPNPVPGGTRHYQTGPRPEEYTYLRALITSNVIPPQDSIKFLIALLPYTEGEKPRFEDRTHEDSQRVKIVRILLERMGVRKQVVELSGQILSGDLVPEDNLYQMVLEGTNIDRPRSEHGREFPVIDSLKAEQALHLISCLAVNQSEIEEQAIAGFLHSPNHRERIEASVIFRRLSFSPKVERDLLEEIRKPYTFREIWSIGKGRPDVDFRDKSYLMMALAAHTTHPQELTEFTDDTKYYRDIRLGLAMGLGFRGKSDAKDILIQLANDPIFSVHRTVEQSIESIRQNELLQSGNDFICDIPPYQPLKLKYAGAKPYQFTNQTPDPLSGTSLSQIDWSRDDVLLQVLHELKNPEHYQSVGNVHIRNAEAMRLYDAGELSRILTHQSATMTPFTPELKQAFEDVLKSPFPFAHYLAARIISLRNDGELALLMIEMLPQYVKRADTVGFYWAAETLGDLNVQGAIPALQQFAQSQSYPGTFGSIGMAYGYISAKTLGRLADDSNLDLMKPLLNSDNVWLKSGALEGLAGRGFHDLVPLMEAAANSDQGALVRDAGRYGLRAQRADAESP